MPRPSCAKRLECVELAPAFEPPHALQKRQQAGRTPSASRCSSSAKALAACERMEVWQCRVTRLSEVMIHFLCGFAPWRLCVEFLSHVYGLPCCIGLFAARSVSRGHHHTILPRSFRSRSAARTCLDALPTAIMTCSRFPGGVAAVSKYHCKSGCLNGSKCERTTVRPASRTSASQVLRER